MNQKPTVPGESLPALEGIDLKPGLFDRWRQGRAVLAIKDGLSKGLSAERDDIREINIEDPGNLQIDIKRNGVYVRLDLGGDKWDLRLKRYESHVDEWLSEYPELYEIDLRYDSQVVLQMYGEKSDPAQDSQTEEDQQSSSDAAWLDQPRPMRRGDCAATRIAEIVVAQEENTELALENGVNQFEYDFQPMLAKWRVGDPVRVCLVAIQNECPQGDFRGRTFVTFNLRTRQKWKADNSRHGCGGA